MSSMPLNSHVVQQCHKYLKLYVHIHLFHHHFKVLVLYQVFPFSVLVVAECFLHCGITTFTEVKGLSTSSTAENNTKPCLNACQHNYASHNKMLL